MFFQQKDPDYVEGQKLLASLILSPDFQTVFNQTKGSIPARLDVDLSNGFNACQQTSQADLKASIECRNAGPLDGTQHDHSAKGPRHAWTRSPSLSRHPP